MSSEPRPLSAPPVAKATAVPPEFSAATGVAALASEPKARGPAEVQERADAKEWYESLARQVEREDNLVSQRLTWLLTFEAFLFTGFGWAATSSGGTPPGIQILKVATILLPTVGILAAVFAWIGVENSRDAAQRLKDE